jgi:glycosyltransferase involved in cell wall biosynthesis
VEVGGVESVQRAARDCDVMMISGPADLGEWLADNRPPVCVSIAHGDGALTREIMQSCTPILDHIVAVSPRVRQMTCDGVAASVIYNGVDSLHICSSRPRDDVRRGLGFTADDYVLGYVGRFSPEKRPGAILEAVAKMPARFKALMVGWGPLDGNLMEFANRQLPGRYAFVEGRQNLGDYYSAMDAFCLASQTEGYGLAIMEAMMCERPVIVTPVGFVPDSIEDRVNGVVIDGAPDSICSAVSLLERHPDWAASMAREGRRFAEQYGHASQMVRQYEDLFERLWCAKHAG